MYFSIIILNDEITQSVKMESDHVTKIIEHKLKYWKLQRQHKNQIQKRGGERRSLYLTTML
jgi:hypothetical protein